VVGKYCDHLPLYRQSGIYAREGVELDRATLADWVGKTAALVSPLVEAVAQHVMAAEKLHADDTPVGGLRAECRHDRLHERRGDLFWKVRHFRFLFAGVSIHAPRCGY
jgi:Transposase IS66 family